MRSSDDGPKVKAKIREEADADARDPEVEASPYAGAAGGAPAHQVGGFHATLPHRGGTLLVIGIFGLLGASLGFCFWPLLLANLLLTLPPWLMAQSDLRAMLAGAMDAEGAGMTRAAHILGIVGTLATLIIFVFMAWFSFKMWGLW